MKYDIPPYAEEIPQQKIYPVIDFPKKPKNLRAFTQTARPLIYKKPSRVPKKAIFLFGVQWYWSPAHSKNDNYFISWTRKHWFLWNSFASTYSPSLIYWDFVGYSNHAGNNIKTIAFYLLLRFWLQEASINLLDHFHLITKTGLMDVADIIAIARRVW